MSAKISVEVPADIIGKLSDARMNFQGISRLFSYYVPSSYVSGGKLPLMITLHGRSFNAQQQLLDSRFVAIAEREHFILVAPNCVTIDADMNLASEGYTFSEPKFVDSNMIRWNAGFELHNELKIDDVSYILALIDYFEAQFSINLKKVFLTGMSNGALMSIYIATQVPEKIAGIGAVTGIVPFEYMKRNISAPMRVVFINGDKDPIVNINGFPGQSPSIYESAEWFSNQLGAGGKSTITYLPQTKRDDLTDDLTKVAKHEWAENNGSQVTLYVVEDGGHTWPSGTQYYPEERIGKLSKQVCASELIWDAFKDFMSKTDS